MLALFRTPGFVLITLAADAFIVYYLVLNAIAKNKIIKGIKAVAGGDLEYQISLEHLRGEQREVAEMLNDIGTGLQKAVEKSVKSERLKTDLITNVSHDIKTPLTSIINYVDILKRSNIEDPKIQGYLEIFGGKSTASENIDRGCCRSIQGEQREYQSAVDGRQSGRDDESDDGRVCRKI